MHENHKLAYKCCVLQRCLRKQIGKNTKLLV